MSVDTAIVPQTDLEGFASLTEQEQSVLVTYVEGGMQSMGRAYAEVYGHDYNDSGVRSNASKFFKKPKIAEALKEYRIALAQAKVAEGAEVLAVLSDIVTGSIVDALDDGGQVNVDSLRVGKLRHLIKSIHIDRKTGQINITQHSKTEAAKILIQTLGIDQGRMQNKIDVNVLNVSIPGIGAGAADAAAVVEQLNELPEGGE